MVESGFIRVEFEAWKGRRSNLMCPGVMRGPDPIFFIQAPLAQTSNGHVMKILMCQWRQTRGLSGDGYHVGVENFDKEWEA